MCSSSQTLLHMMVTKSGVDVVEDKDKWWPGIWGEVFPLQSCIKQLYLWVHFFLWNGTSAISFHVLPSSLGSQVFMGHGGQPREHHVIPDKHKQILPTAPQWRKAATTVWCEAQIQQCRCAPWPSGSSALLDALLHLHVNCPGSSPLPHQSCPSQKHPLRKSHPGWVSWVSAVPNEWSVFL